VGGSSAFVIWPRDTWAIVDRPKRVHGIALDSPRMSGLEASVDRITAETRFSGAVRVDRGGDVQFAKAYGLAHRGHGVANAVDTQFGIASGAASNPRGL
jgi:CubicO group peptidase (beta-lactamase class C family)